MPLAGQILLQQMIDDIKVEARVKGSDNLNITILAIINELLLAQTETDRYSWLLVEGSPIVAVAGQGKYPLPVDFLNIKALYYGRAAEGPDGRVLRHKNDFVERSRDGVEPKFYEITAASGGLMAISLWPYAGILATDIISVDYWGQPNALGLADYFPIPKLYAVIKRKAIARVHLINKDFNTSDRMDKSGDEQEKASLTTEDNADTE